MSENSSTGQTQKRRSSNSRRRKSNAGAKPNPAPAAQAAAGAAGSTESRRPAPRRRSAARPATKQPAEGRQPQASPAAAVVQEGKPAAKRRRRRSPARPGTTSTETRLRIIPLGGMREIGKNLTVYEYDQDMIIVDCGITFPDEDMPGIDIVVPDFAYVLQNKKKLRGIFLTHGHEDHIGALPWLLRDIKVPVYGSRMTLELVRRKLEDRGTGVKGAQLNAVSDGAVIDAGCFNVEFIHVNHSIADANSLAIRTPAGIIFHSGDFKIDYTPINGGPMDLSRIAQIGSEGVLLMFCESTNVEKAGFSPSESTVGEAFAELFGKATGRIFVATFSSNVFRIQQILTAAEKHNRKVALLGRSMLNVFDAANSLGYLDFCPDTLIEVKEIDRYDPDQIVLITTGSQGEPMAALTRMAFSEHRTVEIHQGDTVILSSSAIPGNEKPIYRVINELFRRGAKVIYESISDIHVSGHAYREELKLIHSLVKPRYFVPAHGEYRHLYRHAELGHQMGMDWKQIFILNNGDILEIGDEKADITGFTNAAGVMIDGSGMGDVDNLVLRDRLLLADDGVVTVFIAIDRASGQIIGEPDIQARGFIYESETQTVINECRTRINQFAKRTDAANKPLAAMISSGALRDQLRDLFFHKTKRRPVILVSVLEI